MPNLSVYLPNDMLPYKDDLEFFVSLMVRKLHTNRHKGTGMDLDPAVTLLGASSEINEVWDAMAYKGQFETAVECADVANFVFLTAMASLGMTRQDFKRALEKIEENPDTAPHRFPDQYTKAAEVDHGGA